MIIVQIAVGVIFGFPGAQLLSGGVLSARFGITNVVHVVCALLTTAISANFMSLAYLYFFQRNQIEVFD